MSVRLSNAVGCCPACKNESLIAVNVYTWFWHQYRYTKTYCGIDTCDYSIIKDESPTALHEEAMQLWRKGSITGEELLKRIWE